MSDTSAQAGTRKRARPAPALPAAQEGEPPGIAGTLTIFFFLALLLVPAIWGLVPNWYLRLAGTEARGRAVHVAACEDGNGIGDGPSFQTSVIFQDAQGQLHEIPGDTCTNLYQDGEPLSVWYLPSDPTSTLIGGDNTEFLKFFTGFWLAFALLLGFVFWGFVWDLKQACVRREDFSRLRWMIFGCMLILAPVLMAVSLHPPSTSNPKIGPARDFHPGETVAVDGRWAVIVQGTQVAPVAAGSLCLEIDVTLRNTTSQALAFEVSQFSLYDAQEQALTTSCPLEDATRLASVSLAPGQVTRGVLAYQVAASLHQGYLAFQPDQAHATDVGRSFWSLEVTPAGSIAQAGSRMTEPRREGRGR